MAGTAAIYTISSDGEDETDAESANTIIEFGDGASNPDALAQITNISKRYVEDLSLHPNPNRHLTEIQDGKLGTIEYIIEGRIENPDSAGFNTRLDTMMTSDKSNASLPYGIFGVRYDAMSGLIDFNPSATQGLILFDAFVSKKDEFGKATFMLRLYQNGSV